MLAMFRIAVSQRALAKNNKTGQNFSPVFSYVNGCAILIVLSHLFREEC